MRNLASRALSLASKGHWETAHGHHPLLAETFTEIERDNGVTNLDSFPHFLSCRLESPSFARFRPRRNCWLTLPAVRIPSRCAIHSCPTVVCFQIASAISSRRALPPFASFNSSSSNSKHSKPMTLNSSARATLSSRACSLARTLRSALLGVFSSLSNNQSRNPSPPRNQPEDSRARGNPRSCCRASSSNHSFPFERLPDSIVFARPPCPANAPSPSGFPPSTIHAA